MTSVRKMPDWAYNQMIDGLQKLLVLRLQGAPPADTINALAAVWEEALTPHTWYWRDEDKQRLPIAFSRTIQQAERWVQPAQVIKQIPPRPEPIIAGLLEEQKPMPTPEERKRVRAILDNLLATIATRKQFSLTPPPAKTPQQLLSEWAKVYDPATGKKRNPR